MSKKSKKTKIKIDDIILDAFLACMDDEFYRTREETKKNGTKVYNPDFWEKPKFISLDYIDKYNNIVYTETQPGVPEGQPYYTLGIAMPYEEYKPYHDKWMLSIKRDKKLKELTK